MRALNAMQHTRTHKHTPSTSCSFSASVTPLLCFHVSTFFNLQPGHLFFPFRAASATTNVKKMYKNKVYLQEAVYGRNRIQHDEEEESIQADAGQHERP